ncbi:tetrapyrrole methylase [Dendrothele bispora CBS 962.96]|uniref:Tetrapyrrole methylase n=1 Tax=Dendrothele bispora (strain CBS 962.96) TaxID=1314807 RepID=A0A4V4HEQ6_DENBC|nr:tetrapyrrole methylase [Dendrothele bispora CBS 962.96]
MPVRIPSPQKEAGSLTIVGTGIESIGQITLQAISHIETASKVFYCVVDPATEAFIRTKNKNCFDLYPYYDNGKHRMDTYIQMAEVMLKEVRNGLDVVGVFYGHPGVFVSPSHRALAIAESEGYKARMLPGVSAEDCLFADLRIDPSHPGCMTYEASDFLIRERPVNIHSHLVLWQVGCVGVADFNSGGFKNTKFDVLVDRLEQEYGADHPVVHYMASILPYEDPVTDKFTVSQFRDPQIAKRICGISTFYIPPKETKDSNVEAMHRLQLLPSGKGVLKETGRYPSNKWAPSGSFHDVDPYGPRELAAVTKLKSHTIPEHYQPLATSKAMTDVMTKLALDPRVLSEYKASRQDFVHSVPGLTPNEKNALVKGEIAAIRCGMKNIPISEKQWELRDGLVTKFIVVPIWVSIDDTTGNLE